MHNKQARRIFFQFDLGTGSRSIDKTAIQLARMKIFLGEGGGGGEKLSNQSARLHEADTRTTDEDDILYSVDTRENNVNKAYRYIPPSPLVLSASPISRAATYFKICYL